MAQNYGSFSENSFLKDRIEILALIFSEFK